MLDLPTASHWLEYDARAGVLRWRERPNRRIYEGRVAGTVHRCGRKRSVQLAGANHQTWRVAFLLTFGDWPPILPRRAAKEARRRVSPL